MAELTISADDIQGAIEAYVSIFAADTAREETGTVVDAGDGIAHVEGLPSVMTQELLEFPGGALGVALNLDEHDWASSSSVASRTSKKASRSPGPARSCRRRSATNSSAGHRPAGRADRRAGRDRRPETRRHSRVQAPSVVQRQGVSQPLQTGIKAIDSSGPRRSRAAPADHR